MKILIYGLQSSGASLFSYFLGQDTDSYVIIDLYNFVLCPSINNEKGSTIVKCVITARYSFEEHCGSFNPDLKILFLRNPFDNYVSLSGKNYKNQSGNINEKFRLLDYYFKQRHRFSSVILYEDFISNRKLILEEMGKLKINVDECFFEFNRSIDSMTKFNHMAIHSYSTNGNRYHQKAKYSNGNIHESKINNKYQKKEISDKDKKMVLDLCPEVCKYYEERNR